MKVQNAFAVLLAACLPLVASAVSDVWRATPEEIRASSASGLISAAMSVSSVRV